jgi:hypothetical protein
MREVRHDKSDRADAHAQQKPKPDQTSRTRAIRMRWDLWSSLPRAWLAPQMEILDRGVFLGEILILPVHAVDLPWSTMPQAHRDLHIWLRLTTRAIGSKDGEISRSRPLTRGWEAPVDRVGNRFPASQETRLCWGRGMVIGVSLLSNPTNRRKQDEATRKIHSTGRPFRCDRRAAPPAARGRAVRPCCTSQPTSRGHDRTHRARCHRRADFSALAADRLRAVAQDDR